MFDFFKKKKSNAILVKAPVEGEVVSIHKVSDPTFGEEILGKGIAIKPTGTRVVAPADGTIETMFDTGHAFSMHTDDGTDILVHIGLDTVSLKGQHFTVHAKSGQTVKAGDLLIEFDREAIKSAGFDVITPVVICNTPDYKEVRPVLGNAAELDDIIELVK